MIPTVRRLTRSFLCLLFLMPMAMPLRAQLDTRLQGSKTDFLDLYQQSSTAKVKPELLTVFDFSSSMQTLMYHPLFQNNDIYDNDDMRYMTFQLVAGSSSPNNKYTITATGNNCGVTASYSVTVAPGTPPVVTGAAGSNNAGSCGGTSGSGAPPNYTFKAAAAGLSTAYDTVTVTPVSSANSAASNSTNYNIAVVANQGQKAGPGQQNPYQVQNITFSPSSGPYAPGTVVTFTATLDHTLIEGESSSDDGINWSGGISSGSLSGGSGVYKMTGTFTIPKYTYVAPVGGTTSQLGPITVSGTMATGQKLTFNDTYLTAGTNTKINWSVTTTSNCGTQAGINGGSATVSVTPGTAVTWTIPPCTTASGTNAYVKVTLDASQGVAFSISGLTYANSAGSPLTAGSSSATPTTGLVRPDGSMLTATNFTSYGGSLTINGFNQGAADVRNWIRQASHVRFTSGSRTIDIPIPWNIGTNGSTANPVADQTVVDQETTTTPVTGSGNSIVMDTCYTIDDSKSSVKNAASVAYQTGGVFALTSGAAIPANTVETTVILASVAYRPSYVSWLFNSKFSSTSGTPNYTTDSSLQGKYIVFASGGSGTYLGYGQTSLTWGQAFGPVATPWATSGYMIPTYNSDGSYNTDAAGDPSLNAIPALTRVQAVKRAAISTWIAHQADVFWAYRFLDPVNESTPTSSIDNNSSTHLVNSDSTTTHQIGNDSKWVVLNSNSLGGMATIAGMFPYGETPLTYAMARSLAQFTDPNSVFNSLELGAVSQCANSFLILFTDGIDNNGSGPSNPNTASPYLDGSGNFSALLGNQAITKTPSIVDTTGSAWNLFTYAGIAAHLSDASLGNQVGSDYMNALNPGSSTTYGIPEAFLPYAIFQRAGTTFSLPHRVTTMTVGVSLGGLYNNPSSPKYSLFLAALVGDPNTTTGNLNQVHAFVPPVYNSNGTVKTQNDWVPNPNDPTSYPGYGKKATNAIYYFDGTNPTQLSKCLNVALLAVIASGGNQATSTPNLPYVGASLGSEVYLGKFTIPKVGGVIWGGDLMGFDTKEVQVTNPVTNQVSSVIDILDTTGAVATSVDKSTAQWSASNILQTNRAWSARNLLTRIPGTSTTLEPGLSSFSDQGTAFTDPNVGLVNFVATDLGTGTTATETQQAVIQNASGADITTVALGTRPTASRGNMMGDIIDSNPATLEYNTGDSTITTGISKHNLSMSGYPTNGHFRLILAGTNQGWLHAFGEVSVMNAPGSPTPVTSKADELWAFMPTDFLKNLDSIYGPNAGSSSHRFMVDGTPSIYFLDIPPSTGGTANGILDNGTGSNERAIALIGLGKGGRSYYAIDVKDPFNPVMKWSLVPDEAAWFPHARNLTSPAVTDAALRIMIGNMGFSTCTPGIGRVLFNGVLTDVVFLGGGLSVPEVETNFAVAGVTPILGRSVLALDVNTGNVLSAYTLPNGSDLGAATGPGPVVSGVVPFEYILNSGMAQRAYFTDRSGGLWAWGSKQTVASTASLYPNYRMDASDLAKWTVDGTTSGAAGIRKVYQDGNSLGAIYTTLPAPFMVGSFPGVAKDGMSPVTAVGVAMISGDRYNPVDPGKTGGYYLGRPDHFRLSVVFDRQDSRAWGLDTQSGPDTGITTQMADMTGSIVSSTPSDPCSDGVFQLITPGCPEYYLKPSTGTPDFGYFVNLPADSYQNSQGYNFLNKGITSPMVVAGSLFYSYWSPASYDPCSGATGDTQTNVIASVLNPIVSDTRSGLLVPSGALYTWTGLASSLQGFGTRGVIQGGTIPTAGGGGAASSTLQMKTFQASSAQRHPKIRVWRTVQ